MASWVSVTRPSSNLPTTVSPCSSPSVAVYTKEMPDIPLEILEGILLHLPAKSLMRFRCVSKPWCTLIDSKDFANMHFKKAQESVRFHRLVVLGRRDAGTILSSIDVDSLDHAHPLKPPFVPSEFSNSCNGLILLVDTKNNSLVIWNPFTQKYRTLPPHHVGPKYLPSYYKTKVMDTKYGFGYDSVNGDYKVLIAKSWESKAWQFWSMSYEAKVYSLKSNTWKSQKATFQSVGGSGRWAVHVNGALHTLFPKNRYINGFDLATEKLHHIPMPEGLQVDVFNLTLLALQVFLCLHCKRKEGHDIDIWIMKEYGVKESWTKLLSLAPPLIPTNASVFPVTFSINRQKVLLNMNNELIWFDLKLDAFNEAEVQCSRDGDLSQDPMLKRKRKRDCVGVPVLSVFNAQFCLETIHSPDHYSEGVI